MFVAAQTPIQIHDSGFRLCFKVVFFGEAAFSVTRVAASYNTSGVGTRCFIRLMQGILFVLYEEVRGNYELKTHHNPLLYSPRRQRARACVCMCTVLGDYNSHVIRYVSTSNLTT